MSAHGDPRALYGHMRAEGAATRALTPAAVAVLRARAAALGLPLGGDDTLLAWWGALEPLESWPGQVSTALAELAAFLAALIEDDGDGDVPAEPSA